MFKMHQLVLQYIGGKVLLCVCVCVFQPAVGEKRKRERSPGTCCMYVSMYVVNMSSLDFLFNAH